MTTLREIYLPAQFAIDNKILGNPIQQLRRAKDAYVVEIQPYTKRHSKAQLITLPSKTTILVVPRTVTPPTDVDEVLLITDEETFFRTSDASANGKVRWLKPKLIQPDSSSEPSYESLTTGVRASWVDQFFFLEEQYKEEQLVRQGLRPPQLGALFATLAHWKAAENPATIVMPTGTGKTETMLAILVCQRLGRLLVVVPTNALREQIGQKFIELGILKRCGVVSSTAQYPIVGVMQHRLGTPEEVETYFRCCNVVVTTMSVVSGCSDEVQHKMAELCSHLFIDEAHHVTAPTWEKFRQFFVDKIILQFTATPFRRDGKHIDGKIIFNYPLRKAQAEGYFRPVNFKPVTEPSTVRSDKTIAEAAIRQLEQDLSQGWDHMVMARAADIKRATDIYNIYKTIGTAHSPLLIHSEKSEAEKRWAIQQLRERNSRIVVCVNMLGEGFDLPELKIAALHDVHKSLAITIQFTGRFTRTKDTIGDATMIANTADVRVEEALQELYAEDPDWNHLLCDLSEGATGRQVRRTEFLEGFLDPPAEIPLQNVFPKMSTVVYRTKCTSWKPDNIRDAVKATRLYAGPTLNQKHKVLLFVTQEREPVGWGDIKDIYNIVWDLYVLHWDEKQELLFINSSNNDSLHEELAKAIAGGDVELIRGEEIFRSLYGLNRLILMNLGLNHSLSRAVRFTMYVGVDIHQGLSEAHLTGKYKSNLFGRGFEKGDKASIGCSHKGRIWSYKIAYNMAEWVEWCQEIGAKLLNEKISVREILEHVILPEPIHERPTLIPLTIEWSEAFLLRSEETIQIDIDGVLAPFFEVGMELVAHDQEGPLRFRIFTEGASVEYEVRFGSKAVEYISIGNSVCEIVLSRKRRSLSDWFQQEPPVIRFEDSTFLIYNALYKAPNPRILPFNPDRIETWDWSGINIKRESQTIEKLSDSIQYRTIQTLLSTNYDPQYDIVFDDDDTNEAADVVALKVAGECLIVHFFHCKYSGEVAPGARLKDLYEVCGQAQRSVYWKGSVMQLLDHLRLRSNRRLEKHGVSRFERGDLAKLNEIARQVRYLIPEFKIFVVQPGLLKSKVVASHLDLFASTELYLQETYRVKFGVIAHA